MPGPVSDSYDPEFGTGENAQIVRAELDKIAQFLTAKLGERQEILDVALSKPGPHIPMSFPEKSLRLIRFALEYTMEII